MPTENLVKHAFLVQRHRLFPPRLALSNAKDPGLIISPGRGGEPPARMAHDPPGEHRFACCPMSVDAQRVIKLPADIEIASNDIACRLGERISLELRNAGGSL